MVQIDPLLSYAFASTLAFAERRRATRAAEAPRNELFGLTLLWLGVAFAPQAVYLLWRFPAWETMFVFLEPDQVPAWFAALVPAAIVGFGAAGFFLTRHLLPSRPWLARGLTAVSFALPVFLASVGWDGTGHRRLLFPGTGEEWTRGVDYSLRAFLTSELASTLLWLEAGLLVPYALMLAHLLRSPRPAGPRGVRS